MSNRNYKVGDIVKICRFGERFWCVIKEIQYGTIIAEVDNDLLNPYIKYKDIIYFQPEEVIGITN